LDILQIIAQINGVLWGEWTFTLLMGSGILFTIWTKFIQYRALTHGVQIVRGVYDNPDDPGAINHFQALSAALSATVGLGNIGGVALAIGMGGPGATFWMVVVGLLGMAIKTIEVSLAMMYRNVSNPDNPSGGAMWVIDKTLGQKPGFLGMLGKAMGVFFCITLIISTMTGGNMFQSWNAADMLNVYFGVPHIGTGIVLAIVTGLVIIGGIKRIGHFAGAIVPIMCAMYVLSALAVVAMHIPEIPSLLGLIITSAFSPTEATGAFLGGTAGYAFQVGLKRALFSNEAGQGSAPIAHSAAKTDIPVREGIVAGIEPFIDTVLICTLTALVILCTGTWNRSPMGQFNGKVELIQGQNETKLIAPTRVKDLPELPSWDKWQVGSQIFFVVEVPDVNGQTPKRDKVYGQIVAGAVAGKDHIEWSKPPAGAQWTLRPDGQPMKGVFRDFKGSSLTAHAFDRQFPGLGKWLITAAAILFALSTMISWSYYGEQGVIYLFGEKLVLSYKLIFLLLTMLAPIMLRTDAELGELADLGTGFMLWANMPIVLLLGHLAVKELNVYFKRLKAGEFKPHAPAEHPWSD
jgi:AGCS family alanine or glycine:cation symporter